MSLYNEDQKRKIIMDYYLNPRNRIDKKDLCLYQDYQNLYLHSSSCVDEITLYFNVNKSDFKMIAQGCAIFLSSCEIFIEQILSIGFQNKNDLIKAYEKLINKEKISTNEEELLAKLNIFENVSRHLNRKECASLICKLFKEIN